MLCVEMLMMFLIRRQLFCICLEILTDKCTYLVLAHILLVKRLSHQQKSMHISLIQVPDVSSCIFPEKRSKPPSRGKFGRIQHQNINVDTTLLQFLPQGRYIRLVRDVERPGKNLDSLAGLPSLRLNLLLGVGQDVIASACDDDAESVGLREGFGDGKADACASSGSM